MNILHVTPYFYGAWAYGGIPRLSCALARAQAELGHEVHVVTTDVKDARTRQNRAPEIPGMEVRVYSNFSNFMAYHYQFFTPERLGAEKKRAGQYDVVHLHGHRNLMNTRMAAYAYHAGVPTVLQPNGTLVNIERRQGLKKVYDIIWGQRQVERTDAFVAVSDTEVSHITGVGVPRQKIRVFPNGVDMDIDDGGLSFKEEFGIEDDYILYLGKITPRKGIEHAIAALALMQRKDMLLVVAGNDMGHERELRRIAAAHSVADRVLFTGLLIGHLKAAAYREARYTVYAGRDEIFGLVPWESLLCGTPVIVADDSGCGEWIGKAGAGYIVPYGDAKNIADIIDNGEIAEEEIMVARGREFCRDNLSWSSIAEGMIEYYREVRKWRTS